MQISTQNSLSKMIYLKLPDILEIHKDLIERYGGTEGVRDLGQIEAALFRPQTGYYEDIIQQASALWESLSQNHGFIDGNKRIAFASVYTFLSLNQMEITASSENVWTFLSSLYEKGVFSFENLEPWLRKNTKVSEE